MNELLNISELKKDPTQIIGKTAVCVIKYGKPVFHTVAPSRYEQLLRAERELNELAAKIEKGEGHNFDLSEMLKSKEGWEHS